MATLIENTIWPAGIYQIETTDPVVGGAPNEGTGAGMSNIPHQQLARRTSYLKEQIEAAGVNREAAPTFADFNLITKSGMYYLAAPANAPVVGANYTCLHIAGSGTDNGTQIAIRTFGGGTFIRQKNGGTWGGWQELARLSQGAHGSYGESGWAPLPGGAILQWGKVDAGATTATGTVSVTFPIAFTESVHNINAYDPNSGIASNVFQVGSYNQTLTGMTIGWYRLAGTGGPQNIMWMAIGR